MPKKAIRAKPAERAAKEESAGQKNPGGAATFNWTEEKLERILSKETFEESRVNDAFEGITHPFTALLLIEAREYTELKNRVVERFLDEYSLIYIALNSSYASLMKEFQRRKKPAGNVFFIDMVSIEAGAKPSQSGNVVYLNSPLELTDCIIAVEKKLSESAGKKVIVVLDSVSTLLIYEDAGAVEKFTHALLNKVNAYAASAIVLSAGTGEHDTITSTIGQFFEKTVRLSAHNQGQKPF